MNKGEQQHKSSVLVITVRVECYQSFFSTHKHFLSSTLTTITSNVIVFIICNFKIIMAETQNYS